MLAIGKETIQFVGYAHATDMPISVIGKTLASYGNPAYWNLHIGLSYSHNSFINKILPINFNSAGFSRPKYLQCTFIEYIEKEKKNLFFVFDRS